MEIPALYAERDGEFLRAIEPPARGVIPSDHGTTSFRQAAESIPRGDSRGAVTVVDADSLRAGEFLEGVVKRMRVRGSDIWFMTCVRDADDLMDAFNTVAEKVLAPYHMIDGLDSAKDILSVSDAVIPSVFVRNGGAVRGDLRDIMESLESIGFYRMCVVDTDGSVPMGDWEWIADMFPSTIPFVDDPGRISGLGFEDVIAPLRLRSFRRTPPLLPPPPRRTCGPSRISPDGRAIPSPAWQRRP